MPVEIRRGRRRRTDIVRPVDAAAAKAAAGGEKVMRHILRPATALMAELARLAQSAASDREVLKRASEIEAELSDLGKRIKVDGLQRYLRQRTLNAYRAGAREKLAHFQKEQHHGNTH